MPYFWGVYLLNNLLGTKLSQALKLEWRIYEVEYADLVIFEPGAKHTFL